MKFIKDMNESEPDSSVTVFKAPERGEYPDGAFTIFTAGTIDMGNSVDWQEELTNSLRTDVVSHVVVFNPRRLDWDSSWKQEIGDPQFNEQVTWELEHLELCDLIVLVLLKDSKSPISLLEMGLFCDRVKNGQKRMVVCCEDGFYRQGNVDIVCHQYDVPQVATIGELTEYVKDLIKTSKHGSK